jgi:hypothetical protein
VEETGCQFTRFAEFNKDLDLIKNTSRREMHNRDGKIQNWGAKLV